jgi:2-oxoglutarate dehydrogenase E1 component
MSSSKNLEYQKTSFLSKSNSAFIEEMYLKFINKDTDLPESWKKYFSQIGEELDIVAKEINGPSWNPSKKKANLIKIQKKFENQYENIPEENTLSKVSENDLSVANGESIKAVSLIRSYRVFFN